MKKIIMILGLIIILTACGNENMESKKEASVSHTSPDVYAKFQNIDIQIKQNQANIVGDANVSGNDFFYIVEQGEKILETEEAVQLDGEWSNFEIRVNITGEMEEAENVVIVKMYTKDEDGSIVNPNYVPLDLDGQ